jgi:hypothetical protein
MSPPGDRAVLLRRRALFLGSTLAALGGCEKSGAPPETATGPVVAVPESAPAEPTPTDADAGGLPPRVDPRPPAGAMPSLEIPAGVGDVARRNYEALARRMTRAHALLDSIEERTPKCAIAGCEDDWVVIARNLFDLEDNFSRLYTCPGGSEQAKAFADRQAEHMAYYERRRKDVDSMLRGKLGDAGWARLTELIDKERSANPRPCLSFACSDW